MTTRRISSTITCSAVSCRITFCPLTHCQGHFWRHRWRLLRRSGGNFGA
nr:MAG TPA: Thaumatin family [Caudoviricetes sp.]